jgi:hypothetical protein
MREIERRQFMSEEDKEEKRKRDRERIENMAAEDREKLRKTASDIRILKRANMTEDEIMASNRDKQKSSHPRIPDNMIDYPHDLDHAFRLFWAIGRTYEKDVDDPNKILEPINHKERQKAIEGFKKEMDPNSTIYGCSSCGIWVIRGRKQPYKLRLTDCFELSQEQLDMYNNLPSLYKKVYAITECDNGKFYNIYRHYLENHTESEYTEDDLKQNDFPAVSEDKFALLCQNCYSDIPKFKKPKFSLAAGVNYGAIHFLPKLSFFMYLMLNDVNIYCHVIKFSNGHGQLGGTGQCITFENNLRSQIESIRNRNIRTLPLLPGTDFIFSYAYYGTLDQWAQLISKENKKESDLMSLYGKIISVQWTPLSMWIDVLVYRYPEKWQKSTFITCQEHLDEISDRVINETIIEGEGSIASKVNDKIEEELEPIPGDENHSDSIGTMESCFVTTKDPLLEQELLDERIDLLESAHSQLKDIKLSTNPEPIREKADISIRYYEPPINEYTHMHDILEGFFPMLFPWGCPYKQIVQHDQLQHMLHQASNAFTDNSIFIIYMFNHFMRRKNSQSAKYTFLKDPSCLEQLKEALLDDNFIDEIANAIKNPTNQHSKDLESWLKFLMVRMSSTLNFTAGTASNAVTQMLGLRRFCSNGGFFATFAPQTYNYGLLYRLAYGLKNNNDLNGECLKDNLGCCEIKELDINKVDGNDSRMNTFSKRKLLKLESTYADVVIYMRLIETIFKKLLGVNFNIRYRQNGTILPPAVNDYNTGEGAPPPR